MVRYLACTVFNRNGTKLKITHSLCFAVYLFFSGHLLPPSLFDFLQLSLSFFQGSRAGVNVASGRRWAITEGPWASDFELNDSFL